MHLGFHRSHEASVALLDSDGRPRFAASEERFSRIKMQGGWPRLAAAWVEQHYGTDGARGVHGGLPTAKRFPREARLALYNATHGKLQDVHPKRFRKLADALLGRTPGSGAVFPELERRYVDHHTCHAASAYAAEPVWARTSAKKRSPAYTGPVAIVATMPASLSGGCAGLSCSTTAPALLLATWAPS